MDDIVKKLYKIIETVEKGLNYLENSDDESVRQPLADGQSAG